VSFEDNGLPPQKVTRPFSFSLSAQDAEDIRWYLEDYLVYPLDPQPKIARRIEQRIREIGQDLFRQVLAGTDVWFKARERLEDMRVASRGRSRTIHRSSRIWDTTLKFKPSSMRLLKRSASVT
jgi:hypothetical protein